MSEGNGHVPFPKALEQFPRIRQSMASTFDSCALAAKFEMELRQGWSSHPAARGQLVHRVFAKCLRTMEEQSADRVPKDVALQVLEEVIRQHDVPMDGDPMGEVVVPLPLRQIAEARITVRTWAMYSRYDVQKIAGIEKRLETTLRYPHPDFGSVERIFTGKLDLLLIDGQTATVVDYKDTFGIPPEKRGRDEIEGEPPDGDNVSDEGYFQMRAYALLVLRNYPRIERVVLREVYPRYLSGVVPDGRGRPINPVRQASIERYELPEIEAEMSALVERFDRSVETGVFRPAPGSHCFSGDTRFLTDQGVRGLGEACGERVRVLNRYGEWEDARVEAFGEQPLVRVTFDNGATVDATPDHRWWLADGRRVTTAELERAPLAVVSEPGIDDAGIRHGIIFGDGSRRKGWDYTLALLQPHKAELARYFDPAPVRSVGNGGAVRWYDPVRPMSDGRVTISLQPAHYKTLPERCSPSYARGFIAGLIATDGHVSTEGCVSISCEGRARADSIAALAVLGGCAVTSVRVHSARVPVAIGGVALRRAGEPRELCEIRLKPLFAPIVRSDQIARLRPARAAQRMYARVVSAESLAPAPVFCVVAPVSESFTLASGVVTSNCSYCPRPEACTIFPTARVEGRITSAEEAEKVAGRLNVLDALKSQTSKALRNWANIHGNVRIRDAKRPRVYGPVTRTRVKRPSAKEIDAHISRGGKASDLYREEEHVVFTVHSPEEVHPFAAEAAKEEQALLEMQRAAAERKAKR